MDKSISPPCFDPFSTVLVAANSEARRIAFPRGAAQALERLREWFVGYHESTLGLFIVRSLMSSSEATICYL